MRISAENSKKRGKTMIEKIDNFIFRKWLETLQEIVGTNGLNSILNYAHLKRYIDDFPPDNDDLGIPVQDLQNLYIAIIDLFGQQGSFGLQFNVGRKVMENLIGGRPAITIPIKAATKLMSESRKIRMTLEKFMDQSLERAPTTLGKDRYELIEEKDYFLFKDKDYEGSEGITADRPMCGYLLGMLHYAIEWVSGQPHKLEEIECRCMGDPADTFKIWKSPNT
jgi:hypothetical protein